jgi:proteasome lid subunit RPN8/RPN11
MKWKDSSPDIGALSLSDLTRDLTLTDALRLVLLSREQPFVFIDEKVDDRIIGHLNTSRLEQGGLLIGYVYSTDSLRDGVSAIQITNSAESHESDSTGVSLSMSSKVWQVANSQTENGEFVVGWYHSHPNLGAFFSGTDRHTQRSFFNNAYSLGLVIDPIREERKWFLGPDCVELDANRIRDTDELASKPSSLEIVDEK